MQTDPHYEGMRYYRLIQVLNLLVDKINNLFSWSEFQECFPKDILEQNKELIYYSYTHAFKIFRENVYVSKIR
jgi:hypothetical protein